MGEDPTNEPSESRDERAGAGVRGLHLLALTGFALAQPLFDVLGRDAAFFVVRRSQPIDVWLVACGLALGVPLALWLVERLVGLASRRLEWALHLAFVAVLGALTLAPLAKRSMDFINTGCGISPL